MEKKIRLYLIRHAEPIVLNYKNYFPGPSLGEKGKKQANAIAAILVKKNICRVFASNFTRVYETMKPFLEINNLNPFYEKALWEREVECESHESLAKRVHDWFSLQKGQMLHNTAIFSHCGPINMVLEYLDPFKKKLLYPYLSPHGCLTPMGGFWELELENGILNDGKLIISEQIL